MIQTVTSLFLLFLLYKLIKYYIKTIKLYRGYCIITKNNKNIPIKEDYIFNKDWQHPYSAYCRHYKDHTIEVYAVNMFTYGNGKPLAVYTKGKLR